MKYNEFLESKIINHEACGFDVDVEDLNPMLFDWQKVCVKWALAKGKAALFEACGLGKTPQQLEWAAQIHNQTCQDVLILAPLAVAAQTVREGKKFNIVVNKCRAQDDVMPGINITNYEMLDKFDADSFIGVVLDESGILKSFMGKTKRNIIDTFKNTPYKLACTATPSPNDHMELLNHSDFLDIMPSNEALSRWFINDSMNFGTYRLKSHAVSDFWRWVSTWAVCMDLPSDIGYPDDGFILPELIVKEHISQYVTPYDFDNGKLFKEMKSISASNLFSELRETAPERTDLTANTVNASNERWIVWCNTNYEADLLKKKINDNKEIRGAMPVSLKESILEEFLDEQGFKVLISKPSMMGFGLNLQHISNMAFVGLSYSFEQRYQATRRCWRFGQDKNVNVHLVISPGEKQVLTAVNIKEKRHNEMKTKMLNDVKNYSEVSSKKLELQLLQKKQNHTTDSWRMILGDAVEKIKDIKSESIGFSIFSPPFSNLYIYSDFVQDMGNSKDDKEFFEHFKFLIPELKRITIQGRLCAVHCKDLVDYKSRDGEAGLRDFPGKIITEFEKCGWKYHSRVTIWKDPVIEMQRTKAQGLLHKQIKKDASMSRQGLPDYLIIFRNWPNSSETSGPEPVANPKGFKSYIGDNPPHGTAYRLKEDENGIHRLVEIQEGDDIFSIHAWQRYASPVWFDIQQTNVLNMRMARELSDEKHICPLQLDVISRAIHLWTNPGDTVFSPFAGIGSEGYQAVKMGRKFIGIELKESYYDQAVKYLGELEFENRQLQLFG